MILCISIGNFVSLHFGTEHITETEIFVEHISHLAQALFNQEERKITSAAYYMHIFMQKIQTFPFKGVYFISLKSISS